jgi:hypothetical protein
MSASTRSPRSTGPGRALPSVRSWESSFRRRSSVRRSSAPLPGGGIGHALGGMSRKDAKELGEQLDDGQAALIVIGQSRVQEQLDKALTRAQKSEERELDADGEQLAKELDKVPA